MRKVTGFGEAHSIRDSFLGIIGFLVAGYIAVIPMYKLWENRSVGWFRMSLLLISITGCAVLVGIAHVFDYLRGRFAGRSDKLLDNPDSVSADVSQRS
ncbi:MAG TPA: hypothetical protein VNS63_09615 [Blastocatellia bacterium]|nr:hypothetical protein [Blastocatellia bacterium]